MVLLFFSTTYLPVFIAGYQKIDSFLVHDREIAVAGEIRSIESRTYSLLIRRIKTVKKIYNFVAICNLWSQQDSNLRPLAFESNYNRNYSLNLPKTLRLISRLAW